MMLINDFISRHTELTETWIYIIRGIQVSIVVGLVFLYTYMLKMRAKYSKKVGGFVNSFLARPVVEKGSEEKSINKSKESEKQD
jgi:ABC-type phosphate transport system permease subunit